MDDLFDHPFGSDWSSNVNKVVVGESASIAQPWRSTWVRIIVGSDGGMVRKMCLSSVENENTWTAMGDLYDVLKRTESRALQEWLGERINEKGDEGLLYWPGSLGFMMPQLSKLIYVLEEHGVVEAFVPIDLCTRSLHDTEQVPDPDPNKDGFCAVYNQSRVDGV